MAGTVGEVEEACQALEEATASAPPRKRTGAFGIVLPAKRRSPQNEEVAISEPVSAEDGGGDGEASLPAAAGEVEAAEDGDGDKVAPGEEDRAMDFAVGGVEAEDAAAEPSDNESNASSSSSSTAALPTTTEGISDGSSLLDLVAADLRGVGKAGSDQASDEEFEELEEADLEAMIAAERVDEDKEEEGRGESEEEEEDFVTVREYDEPYRIPLPQTPEDMGDLPEEPGKAVPQHRESLPGRPAIRKEGAEVRTVQTVTVEVMPTVAYIKSHRHNNLWFPNPGMQIQCGSCGNVYAQICGSLHGAHGRSQFAQPEFICHPCLARLSDIREDDC